jgi:hypothetical protein
MGYQRLELRECETRGDRTQVVMCLERALLLEPISAAGRSLPVNEDEDDDNSSKSKKE